MASTALMEWLFVGRADGTIEIVDFFDSINGKRPHETGSALLATSPNAPVLLTSWKAAPAGVSGLACHPQGAWALVGTQEGQLRLFTCRLAPGTLQFTADLHAKRVTSVCLTASATAAWTASWDQHLGFTDLHTGQTFRTPL